MIIYAASPFQLVSAYDYLFMTDTTLQKVLVVESNIKNSKYLEITKRYNIDPNLLEFIELSPDTKLKNIRSLTHNLIFCIRKNVILGTNNNIYLRLFSLFSANCIIVDDGTEVLHAKLTQRKFGIIKKCVYQMLNYFKRPTYHSVIVNNGSHTSPQSNPLKPNLNESKLLLILSPITEEGILSHQDYGAILVACGEKFHNKFAIRSITIVAHPRSAPDTLEFVRSNLSPICKCEIWEPKATVELSLNELSDIPQYICSFESTASLRLEQLYPSDFKHCVYPLPQNLIKSYKKERLIISDHFVENFKGVIV